MRAGWTPWLGRARYHKLGRKLSIRSLRACDDGEAAVWVASRDALVAVAFPANNRHFVTHFKFTCPERGQLIREAL